MKNLRNSVQLIGNLGMDPDVKELDGGKTVVKLSLATSEIYKNAQGKRVTDTQWHSLVAWGNTAKIAGEYLKKGSEIAVEGRLVHRSYEDKTGQRKYYTEIVVNELLMLNTGRHNSNTTAAKGKK